jgi:membrane-associated phospholipid phosphatase
MQIQENAGRLLLMTTIAVGIPISVAGQDDPGSGNAVTHWSAVGARLMVDPGPILEARPLAIFHAAIHDAANGVERRFQPYTADLSFPGASLEAAVATAARDVLMAFSPTRQAEIEAEYAAALAVIPDGPAEAEGVILGRLCAQANIDRRINDGIATVNEPVYVPTGEPGDYDFTPPFDAPPLGPRAFFPGFGRLTPFVIDVAKHSVHGPDRLSGSLYTFDFNLLKSIGSVDSSIRNAEQTEIAHFWTERPNRIWARIAVTILRDRDADPWQAARTLALVHFAITDAGIAVMADKYHFRSWRPYTAIRRAADDGNAKTEPDAAWQPLLQTPPIPDYPSDQSDLNAAVAEVLIRHFGDRMHLKVTSTTLPGVTRRFESLTEAAWEGSLSRVYGGVHFLRAVVDGYWQGKRIGRVVSRALPSTRDRRER